MARLHSSGEAYGRPRFSYRDNLKTRRQRIQTESRRRRTEAGGPKPQERGPGSSTDATDGETLRRDGNLARPHDNEPIARVAQRFPQPRLKMSRAA